MATSTTNPRKPMRFLGQHHTAFASAFSCMWLCQSVYIIHPEIQYEKPQCQYNLCQECGFLYSISQCRERGARAWGERGGGEEVVVGELLLQRRHSPSRLPHVTLSQY
eukprot:1739354-Rhodomonas_salina.6